MVIAAWAVAGLVAFGIGLDRTLAGGWPGSTAIWFSAVFGVLMAVSWIWPITLYIGGESDAIDFDEGFLVLFLLLVPASMSVLVFAAVTVAAQAIKRRPFAKSIFNVGQVVTSAGVGAVAFVLLQGSTDTVGYAKVGAAIVGALCYFVVNTGSMVTIMVTLGTPWRKVVFAGIEGKLLIAAGGICIAIPAGLLLAQHPRYLLVALLPAIILRFVGAGHFYARHDRARLHGLFEATLDVNRSMGIDETKAAVLNAASSLLRSPDASLGVTEPGDDELAAPMAVGDETLWLRVAGRSQTEPFDDADQTLVEALASVGSVALANTSLYAEVQQQKDKLSIITSSLGEGVCAISETGEISFLNPAGASMLGWYTVGAGEDDGPILPAHETPRFLLDPAMRAIALRRNVTSYDTRFDRPDGSHFPVTMTASPVVGGSAPSGAVIVFRDTSERKAFEEQLARHAFQDALTGLANRRLLLDHLDHALLAGGPQRQPGGGAVLRHRPLQGGERQPGPPGGRRAPAGDRRAPASRRAARRHALALRRGRVRHPARGHHVARRRQRRGQLGPRRTARPDRAQRRPRGRDDDEHRHRAERVRQVARRPAPRRGRGHVSSQGPGSGRTGRHVRRGPHGRPFGRPPRSGHRVAPRGRAGRGRDPLPAAGLARRTGASSGPRRWCAGTTPTTGCSCPPSSFSWPRTTAPSCPSDISSWSRPAAR